MLAETILLRLPAAKLSVIVSALLYARLAKVARPLTAVAVVVPWSASVPLAIVALTTVLLSEVIKLPEESSMRITGCWAKAAPATAPAEGWVRTASRLASPETSRKSPKLATLETPARLAVPVREMKPDARGVRTTG